MGIDLNERSKLDFLIYANSVIKSRAIPLVEDNLKPIHRKILYTLFEEKLTPDKKTRKCATIAGAALKYSPHGDASVYGAMVRMSQWWKLRYPLIEMQGNCGNIMGDGPAASRYTECKLSKVGQLMLEGLNKECIDFKPNYDGTTEEPVTLPSKFPYLLCGNNSGIAVGLSSDLVSHNFSEVAEAIKFYLKNKDCTVADLMKYIKGPDFPTGGKIINGDDLYNIYCTGKGSVKVVAHYDVAQKGNKTLLIFHDIPYGVDIDSGVKAPLKKLVLEDGYEIFEDIDVKKVGEHNFDITITLGKNADAAKCLEILFTKTRLSESIKINQTVIINGEPKTLNLKQLIEYWVNYRSTIIKRIAQNNYGKTQHKLTIVLGLQKCMSDIDLLIKLIRESDNPGAAKIAIMKAFELNDEQATAVLDMKISKLSRLDIAELKDDEKKLEETLAQLKKTIDDEEVRYDVIRNDLNDIKKVIGKDDRLTEIDFKHPDAVGSDRPMIKQEWLIYPNSLGTAKVAANNYSADDNLVDVVYAYSTDDVWGFNATGEMASMTNPCTNVAGGFVKGKNKVIAVTKSGNIKVSLASEYKWKNTEKVIKLKDGDELCFASTCDDNDFVFLFNGEKILKLAIKDLPVASKLTVGVKSGFEQIVSASVAKTGENLLCVTSDNKAKLTPVSDFSNDSRGNKGQNVAEKTIYIKRFDDSRAYFFIVPKVGKISSVSRDKISIKSRTAIGANISTKNIVRVV